MAKRNILCRYATPLTTGLFVVSLVSGVALYFHVGGTWARGMHEVISMLLIPFAALHIWRNWSVFAAYFHHGPMWIALAISLLLAMPFLSGADGGGRHYRHRGGEAAAVLGALGQADVAAVAALARTDTATVIDRFAAAGIYDAGAIDTISDLAERSGRNALDVVAVALAP